MNVAQLQLVLGRLTSPAATEKPDLAGYEAQGELSGWVGRGVAGGPPGVHGVQARAWASGCSSPGGGLCPQAGECRTELPSKGGPSLGVSASAPLLGPAPERPVGVGGDRVSRVLRAPMEGPCFPGVKSGVRRLESMGRKAFRGRDGVDKGVA